MSSELHFHELTDAELSYISGGGAKLGVATGEGVTLLGGKIGVAASRMSLASLSAGSAKASISFGADPKSHLQTCLFRDADHQFCVLRPSGKK